STGRLLTRASIRLRRFKGVSCDSGPRRGARRIGSGAMAGRLEGKVAVITGAASGIGAGTARRFVEEGARCVLADLQDEPGQRLAAELGEGAAYVHADVSQEDDVA